MSKINFKSMDPHNVRLRLQNPPSRAVLARELPRLSRLKTQDISRGAKKAGIRPGARQLLLFLAEILAGAHHNVGVAPFLKAQTINLGVTQGDLCSHLGLSGKAILRSQYKKLCEVKICKPALNVRMAGRGHLNEGATWSIDLKALFLFLDPTATTPAKPPVVENRPLRTCLSSKDLGGNDLSLLKNNTLPTQDSKTGAALKTPWEGPSVSQNSINQATEQVLAALLDANVSNLTPDTSYAQRLIALAVRKQLPLPVLISAILEFARECAKKQSLKNPKAVLYSSLEGSVAWRGENWAQGAAATRMAREQQEAHEARLREEKSRKLTMAHQEQHRLDLLAQTEAEQKQATLEAQARAIWSEKDTAGRKGLIASLAEALRYLAAVELDPNSNSLSSLGLTILVNHLSLTGDPIQSSLG